MLYNNRYAEARGWLRRSAAFRAQAAAGAEGAGSGGAAGEGLVQEDLGQALGLPAEAGVYCRFREAMSGLEYLRPARDLYERGLYVELGAYRYQVFLDFREARDAPGAPWSELEAALGGRGVPSLDDALADLVLRPVQQGFRAAYDPAAIRALAGTGTADAAAGPAGEPGGPPGAVSLAEAFFRPLARFPGMGMNVGERARAAADLLARAGELGSGSNRMALADWALLWAWVLLSGTPGQGRRLLEELRLEWVLRPAWEALGIAGEQASEKMALLRLLLSLRPWLESLQRGSPLGDTLQESLLRGSPQQEGPKEAAGLRRALQSEEGRAALRIPAAGPFRLDPAAWAGLVDWIAGLAALLDPEPAGAQRRAQARAARWGKAARACDYRFPDLLERLDA